jgi:hypothetical protein
LGKISQAHPAHLFPAYERRRVSHHEKPAAKKPAAKKPAAKKPAAKKK